MAKALSLKMDAEVFQTTDKIVKRLKMARNAYINQAIRFYNRLYQRRLLAQELRKESRLVRSESQVVLEEFERLHEGLR
ncbi:MAG: hypothetical protein HYZ73_08500 [Elusimicrobia bacterium]|nr:hypothetical protein [Elusimicrobiota bacterium]